MSARPVADDMLESPEIAGLLYKRRGGFGKIMPNAWQYRFFVITKEGILLYFDTTEVPEEGYSESKARGRLDLRSLPYDLNMEPIEGAPTQFFIQIAIPNEEKWKLCAETKEDQGRWYKVLEKFNQDKPAKLAKALNYTSDEDQMEKSRRGSSFTPRSADQSKAFLDAKNSSFIVSTGQGGLQLPPSTVSTPTSTATDLNSQQKPPAGGPMARARRRFLKANTKATAAESMQWYELLLSMAILNICFVGIVRAQSIFSTAFYILVGNLVIYQTLCLRGKRVLNNAKEEPAAPAAAAPAPSAVQVETKIAAKGGLESPLSPSTSLASPSAKPVAGMTFKEVPADLKDAPPHTWAKADHRLFSVRIGPDYNRHKKKAPSASAIYEPVAFDVFCTKKRLDHCATGFQLPDTSAIDTHNPNVPPLLVIQVQIPSEPPTSLFSSAEDGPGWAMVMYYRITEDSCNQLKDLSTASPAVKLFAEWCEKAPTDPAWRGRFKVICLCTNFEELGFPSMITAYNGKPVLIRRTGTLFRGSNYLEMNIHVHKFANVAKQSIYLLTSRCATMNMNIGFVIEGRENDELPETLFACCSVNRPQEDQAEFLFEED